MMQKKAITDSSYSMLYSETHQCTVVSLEDRNIRFVGSTDLLWIVQRCTINIDGVAHPAPRTAEKHYMYAYEYHHRAE